jgi:hypothetical protein
MFKRGKPKKLGERPTEGHHDENPSSDHLKYDT